MKHGFVKVAAMCPKVKVADVEYNAERICEKLDEARRVKAKVVVFPELCVTGYTCGDLFLQRTLIKAAKEALMTSAQQVFAKVYEQAQAAGAAGAGPDMGAAGPDMGAGQAQDNGGDDVVDGEFREV